MLPFDARVSVQHQFDSSPLPKGFERIGPKIIAAPPITLRDLLGGFLPRRYDIELAGESISGLWKEDADRGQKFYEEYADGIFYPFEITHEGNVKEYIVFCPPVTGEGLNGLMYLAAPEKLYGYRTADIINDWNDLYTLPSNEKRRAAHERLPNWYIFAKYRQTILELIMKYHYKRPFNSLEDEVTNSLVPIINWKIGTNGERKWIFEPLTDPTSNAIITHLKVKGVALPSDRQRFVPLLGGLVLAAFDPSIIIKHLPNQQGYSEGAKGQSMTPTQVVPLVAWKMDAFLPELNRLEIYLRTGEVIASEEPNPIRADIYSYNENPPNLRFYYLEIGRNRLNSNLRTDLSSSVQAARPRSAAEFNLPVKGDFRIAGFNLASAADLLSAAPALEPRIGTASPVARLELKNILKSPETLISNQEKIPFPYLPRNEKINPSPEFFK